MRIQSFGMLISHKLLLFMMDNRRHERLLGQVHHLNGGWAEIIQRVKGSRWAGVVVVHGVHQGVLNMELLPRVVVLVGWHGLSGIPIHAVQLSWMKLHLSSFLYFTLVFHSSVLEPSFNLKK